VISFCFTSAPSSSAGHFSRNPFFAALLVRQSEEAEKFWSIMPPKEEEEKIVAFRAASFDEFLAIILPWQRKTFLRRL